MRNVLKGKLKIYFNIWLKIYLTELYLKRRGGNGLSNGVHGNLLMKTINNMKNISNKPLRHMSANTSGYV